MMKMSKKLLSLLLCAIMVLGTIAIGGDGFAEVLDAFIPKASAAYSIGSTIEYGTYPQSRVTDEELIASLNNVDGQWKSYGFHDGERDAKGELIDKDYMRYKDISYNDEKYRAVTFDKYRPANVGYGSSMDDSKQDDNGYYVENIYWFKYDPIVWRVIDPEKGIVMCCNAIDAAGINELEYYGYSDTTKQYAFNDYSHSTIRTWLNNTFYDTAFTAEQKANILTTSLDDNTINDKVYLFSFNEVRSKYNEYNPYYDYRHVYPTEYSKCMGLLIDYAGRGNPLLRDSSGGSGYISAVFAGMVVNTVDQKIDIMSVAPGMTLSELQTNVKKEFRITYDANGGEGAPDTQIKKQGEALTLSSAVPDRADGTFKCWNTRVDGLGTSYEPGASIDTDTMLNLYAQWEKSVYTVSYDANGGTGAPQPQSKAAGEEVVITSDVPVREGYALKCWNTEKFGSGISYDAGDVFTLDVDITLYAQWHQVNTITYDSRGGKFSDGKSTKEISYEINKIIPELTENPVRENCTFLGWNSVPERMPNYDITVTANWKVNGQPYEYRNDDLFNFGSYPQSRVDNEATITALNGLAPSSKKDWKNYGYYTGNGTNYDGLMTSSDYMLYCDVDYNNEKYRGVYFSKYRGASTGDTATDTASNQPQYNNGYYVDNVYWFKYEPLEWKILDTDRGLAVCTSIVDAQAFNNTMYKPYDYYNPTTESNGSVSVSDYSQSSLRAWFNNSFYDTAFSTDEKALLAQNEGDYVYPLSGIESQSYNCGAWYCTEYSRCQGYSQYQISTDASSNTMGESVRVVKPGGAGYIMNLITRCDVGIAPAIRVKFNRGIEYDANGGTGAPAAQLKICGTDLTLSSAVPTREGYIFLGWNTVADGSGTAYQPSATYKEEKSVILYAQWHTHSYVPTVTPSTCEKDGVTVYTCSCGDSYSVPIPALGHEYVDHEAKEPTCEEVGWYAYQTCSRCDYSTYEERAALGHDYIDHEGKEPTCGEYGWDAYQTCSRCDYTSYNEIPALGHEYVDHEAKAPTCLEIGWDAYQTCSRCDYSTYSEIPALGHEYVGHEAKAPTCLEIGWDAYQTCSRCDYSTYSEIPALGHSYIWTYNNDATKDTDGTETQLCHCGKTGETRIAEGTRFNCNAVISVSDGSTLDWRTKTTIVATATGVSEGYHLEMTIGDKTYKGSRTEVKSDETEIKGDITYSVKIVEDSTGNEQEAFTKQAVVKVNAGFFKKLIAFFKGLFNLLPKVEVKP